MAKLISLALLFLILPLTVKPNIVTEEAPAVQTTNDQWNKFISTSNKSAKEMISTTEKKVAVGRKVSPFGSCNPAECWWSDCVSPCKCQSFGNCA